MKKTVSVLLALGALAMLSVSASGPEAASAQEAPQKPNIVFVLTDDQAESTLQYMPVVQRRLGNMGMTFENTVSSNPLCCPARVTLQRGQYTHNHKVFTNQPPAGGYARFDALDLEKNTVATWLDDVGYRTGYFGKYMNGYGKRRILPGWDRWYAKAGPERFGTINDQGRIIHVDTFQDAAFKSAAVRWVKRNAAPSSDPFFLMLAPNAPHLPANHDERYDSQFQDARVPRTPAYNEADTSDKPEWVRQFAPLSEQEQEEVDSIYRDQLRSLRTVDTAVGSIIQVLKDQEELKNTYIVYYTDNGVHYAEHRIRYGKQTPYAIDARFPLMVRGPGVGLNSESPALVSSNDVAPTLADMGGARVPDFVDGRSLLPVVDGEPSSGEAWRTALLSYHWRADTPLEAWMKPEWWALMTEQRTYVEYETEERELYDLETDPYELENMLYNPTPEAEAKAAKLSARLEALKGCAGDGCRTAENAP